MTVTNVGLEGVFIIEPVVYNDGRGFFYEFFNQAEFKKQTGTDVYFIQDNLARSHKNVLRGFHFQKGEFSQAKLVSVISGAVLDVIVDLRKNQPTFGQTFSIVLSAENKKQLFIPRGFAHAYLSLEDDTLFFYKIDNIYHKESEAGIRFDDPDLAVDWQNDISRLILSEKDQGLPYFKDIIEQL
jgi:dTDP-4-dehydrorhamnose 3,5-epimerase